MFYQKAKELSDVINLQFIVLTNSAYFYLKILYVELEDNHTFETFTN